MRYDVYERLLESTPSKGWRSLPTLSLTTRSKLIIRIVGNPLTYFVSTKDFSQIGDPMSLKWTDHVLEALGARAPEGYVKADADEVFEACCNWPTDDEGNDLQPETGQRWNLGEEPPENGAIQLFRVACFDRHDGLIKWLDFGGEVYSRVKEWQDNYGESPGGMRGPDFRIAAERLHSGHKLAITTWNLDRKPFTDYELRCIQAAGLSLGESAETSCQATAQGMDGKDFGATGPRGVSLLQSSATKMTREEVYKLIDGERAYQDALPSTRTMGDPKKVGEYLVMLQHYQAKAVEAWTINAGDSQALDVIRKIAGIAVHCMEDHGAPPRKPKEMSQ